MAPEIEKINQLLKQNAIYECAKPFMDNYKRKIKTIKKKISIAERPPSPTTSYSNTFVSARPELILDADDSE